jgi:hypothetical protein
MTARGTTRPVPAAVVAAGTGLTVLGCPAQYAELTLSMEP